MQSTSRLVVWFVPCLISYPDIEAGMGHWISVIPLADFSMGQDSSKFSLARTCLYFQRGQDVGNQPGLIVPTVEVCSIACESLGRYLHPYPTILSYGNFIPPWFSVVIS